MSQPADPNEVLALGLILNNHETQAETRLVGIFSTNDQIQFGISDKGLGQVHTMDCSLADLETIGAMCLATANTPRALSPEEIKTFFDTHSRKDQ